MPGMEELPNESSMFSIGRPLVWYCGLLSIAGLGCNLGQPQARDGVVLQKFVLDLR